MRTVYVVAFEDNAVGGVDWYFELPAAERAYEKALSDPKLKGNEINLGSKPSPRP